MVNCLAMSALPDCDRPLPRDIDALQALVRAQREQIAELEQQLAWFKVHYRLAQQQRFAASSERWPEQLDLFAEVLEAALAALPEAAAPDEGARTGRTDKPGGEDDRPTAGRGRRQALPAELPREPVIHDLPEAQKRCPCCGQSRQVIGQERSEQLDIVPAKLKVIEHIRLKYACRACEHGGPLSAAKPAQPIEKSNAAPGLLAYLVIAKVADGLPLYRQERIFEQLGRVRSGRGR